MGLGSAQRELFYDAKPRDAFSDALVAMGRVGKVLDSSEKTYSFRGRTRHGLQRVILRVSVVPADRGSLIRVAGASDDVWGAAARKGSDKFVTALGGG